jgi:hypothetical protein
LAEPRLGSTFQHRCPTALSLWSRACHPLPASRCVAVVTATLLVLACGMPSPSPSSASPTAGTPASAAPSPSASVALVPLMSLVPLPYAVNAGDAASPAWQPGTGFTPDATKALVVAALQVQLALFRAANGSYPSTLVGLYPAFAPLGVDGQPIAVTEIADYAYSTQGPGTYNLSVTLASGATYAVRSPGGP